MRLISSQPHQEHTARSRLRVTRWPLWLMLLFSASVAACEERAPKAGANAVAGAGSNAGDRARASQRADYSVRGLIVVLGSSTAAGIGPHNPKSAWVSRYKAHLSEQFPNVQLVNLAVGGYSTFEVQPTGFVPPPGRPAPVEGRNITFALGLKPSAIVINLPSNDQARHYALAEQLANYDRIAALAAFAHVPLWICSPQPRNFDESAQLDDLMRARDAIARKFAPRTLDFWTPFAAANGFIKASYNAGDGTHLNDAAHEILASIVESAQIPEQFAAAPVP